MISRRILPSRTAVSLAAMTLRCQFIARRVCGLRSWKQRIAKIAKSWRSRTLYSAGVSLSDITFPLSRSAFELLDHLLVRLAEGGGLGGCRLGLALDVSHQVEQDLDRAPIRRSRAVDELSDDRLALGDLPTPAVLGHDNRLVQRVTQERLEILCSGRPASRIAGLTFREAGLARRLAVAHLVIALAVRRHWPPPPRARGRQS